MPITPLNPSDDLTAERIARLRQVLPEAFADGRINWEALRELLGAYLEEEGNGEPEDEPLERFGLSWPGKRLARRAATLPAQGALAPAPGEGVDEEHTRNLFIEGDNLEVLRLLRKAYAGRVKMIYIDPPYNTGNDFVYKDNYAEPVESYLRRTGQMDEEGKKLTSHTATGGRYHSNWLNMMYPRLVLARELLSDDGLLFASIDDNEVTNLHALLDEVFGPERFQSLIVWKNKYGPGALTKGIASLHEYILCFGGGDVGTIEAPVDSEAQEKYRGRDGKYPTRGGYITQPLATRSKDDRPNLVYPIHWNGHEIWPDKQWIWSRDRMEGALANDDIVIRETDGKFSVRFKQYLRDESGQMRKSKPLSLMLGPFNQDGTSEIRDLFGSSVFGFPKPSRLISHFCSMMVDGDDGRQGLVLDFFSGSCTTAHAVLNLNREDGGSRRFIMVQLPEPTDREDYPTIAEIGKERIRRVIARMRAEEPPADVEREAPEDLGFKVYKLGRSNVRRWQTQTQEDTRQVQDLFNQFQSPLVEGWGPEALLTEVMLMKGFPLDSRVQDAEGLENNRLQVVSSEACAHRLWVCLDETLTSETAAALPTLMADEDVLVCLDSALTDEIKVRLDDRLTIETI